MATNPIFFQTQPILPAQELSGKFKQATKQGAGDFSRLLDKAKSKVVFSEHAKERLLKRNIDLSEEDLTKLETTVSRMADKGARESLIYMNDVALVVSVANRKVITAMDGMSAKDNIFTNIDSAAII